MVSNPCHAEIRLWLWLSVVSTLFIISGVLFYPLGGDTSALQWVAYQFVRNGAWPYLGTWEPNFPGVLPFHIVSVMLFGWSEVGFRIVELTFQIFVSVAFFRLLLRWLTPRASFFGVFLYAVAYLRSGTFYFGQRDVFAAGLFVFAGVWWFRNSGNRRAHLAFAGLLMGWAILIRPLFVLLPLTMLAVSWRGISWPMRRVVFLTISIPFILSLVPYLLLGKLGAYYESTFAFLVSLYPAVGSPRWWDFIRMLYRYDLFVLLGMFALWLRRGNQNMARTKPGLDRSFFYLYALLLFDSLAIVAIQHRFLAYHFAIFLMLICPLAGAGLERIISLLPRVLHQRILTAAALATILLTITPFASIARYACSLQWCTEGFGGEFLDGDGRVRTMDDSTIRYLSMPGNADGAVEICSYDGRPRARLHREEATRFAEFQALTLRDADGKHPLFQTAWRNECIQNMTKTPPRFVLLDGLIGFWDSYRPPRFGLKTDFSVLDSILAQNYRPDTVLGRFAIFRIRQDSQRYAKR